MSISDSDLVQRAHELSQFLHLNRVDSRVFVRLVAHEVASTPDRKAIRRLEREARRRPKVWKALNTLFSP